jgi:hypothetical protein
VPPIEAHLRAAEQRLIGGLLLRPRALQPRLGEAVGRWKDAPVTITTRAYEGDAVSYVRLAVVSGVQLVLGSLLAVPRANRPVPILGADLVWRGAPRELAITADLSPVRDPLERDAELAEIARVVPDRGALPPAGELPRWRSDWFSPSVLHTRVGPAQEKTALAAFDGYVAGFITLLGATPPSAERAYRTREIQDGYALAHRTDDQTLGMLAMMFGKAWADEYVTRVLFPSSRTSGAVEMQ